MKYCEKCGSSLNDNAEFCSSCGTPCNSNGAVAPTVAAVQSKEKNNKALLIVLIVLVAVLITAVAILALTMRSKGTSAEVETTVSQTQAIETTAVTTTAAPTTEAPTQAPAPTTMPVAAPTTTVTVTPPASYKGWEGAVTTITTKGGNLNIRSGPGEKYQVIGSIPNGAQITVLDGSGEWSYIRYNGITGYAATYYIDPLDNDP